MNVNVSQAIMNIPPNEKNITNLSCVIMFVYQKISQPDILEPKYKYQQLTYKSTFKKA